MVVDRFSNIIEMAKSRAGIYDEYKPFFPYFDTLSENEINNINLVLRNLNFGCTEFCESECDFLNILTGAKESLDYLSPAAIRIFKELYSDLEFVFDDDADSAEFASLAYPSIKNSKSICRYTVQIVIPQKLEECSKYFLAHEFIHVIKDINPDEVKLIFTKFETIPILWEFIQSYCDDDYELMSRLFTQRYMLMLNIKSIFNDANLFLKEYKNGNIQCDKKIVQEIIYLKKEALMYLNSFYYAIALFQKFMQNNRLVLDYINEVLSCEINTKDFIDKFNQCNFDKDYQEGFKKIKSFLKL